MVLSKLDERLFADYSDALVWSKPRQFTVRITTDAEQHAIRLLFGTLGMQPTLLRDGSYRHTVTAEMITRLLNCGWVVMITYDDEKGAGK